MRLLLAQIVSAEGIVAACFARSAQAKAETQESRRIAMTTSSSIRVNPRFGRMEGLCLPFRSPDVKLLVEVGRTST